MARASDWGPLAAMASAFLVVMPLAVWFARPFQAAAPELPQDPTAGANALFFLLGAAAFVVLATGMAVLVLWAVRTGRHKIIQAMVFAGVAVALLVGLARPVLALSAVLGPDLAWLVGLAVSVAVSVWLYRRPHRIVQNAVGVLVAAAVAGLTAAVLGVTPLLVLLVAIAVYDQVAVKRTKHMQKLAQAVVRMRLPMALRFGGDPVVRRPAPVPGPEATWASAEAPPRPKAAAAPPGVPARPPGRHLAKPGGMALLMGLGDLVFPAALVAAAADPRHAWGWAPAVVTGLGVLAGLALVVRNAWQGEAQPGLPLLNGGAILGFLVGVAAATGRPVWW